MAVSVGGTTHAVIGLSQAASSVADAPGLVEVSRS
jgi:hypothetical protein